MDWQSFAVSFVIVFLSELGDKSQLVAITLGSNARSATAVFLGVASGLVCTTFFRCAFGQRDCHIDPCEGCQGDRGHHICLSGFLLAVSISR